MDAGGRPSRSWTGRRCARCPSQRYEVGAWKLGVGVNVDYHLEYDHRHYSVPCELISEKVDVRATANVIEVWRDHRRVTSHERSYGPEGTAVTKPEHRPRVASRVGGVAGGAARGLGADDGGAARARWRRRSSSAGQHPESGRRACLRLMRMGERYGAERLEAACVGRSRSATRRRGAWRRSLKNGLEKVALAEEVEPTPLVHENIRGGDYFDRGEVTSSREEVEIEARYLEDERQSIIHEPRTDTSAGETTRRRQEEVRLDGVSLGVASSRASARTESLSALIGRAQVALSGLLVVKQNRAPEGGRSRR